MPELPYTVTAASLGRTTAAYIAYTVHMYTYRSLQRDISFLGNSGFETGSIGKSVFGNDIYYVKVGSGGRKIIVTGGIHARENVSSYTVIRMAYYATGQKFDGTVYYIPMLNPDGALLVEKGASFVGGEKERWLVEVNGGRDFSQWKANGNAVDLNTNFDARWGTGAQNIRYPAPANYIGPEPFSEPETRAVAAFTVRIGGEITLSYHALGREIYWYFYQRARLERDRALGEYIASVLKGYRLDGAYTNSAGGYKDWCIAKAGLPGYTIELVGGGKHPLPLGSAEYDYEVNKDLPILLTQYVF